MNPKITKLRAELQKNKSKISDLQVKNRELEKQIRELENIDIIGMVRERGLTMEQFIELLGGASVPAQKKEESDYEEI